MDYRLLIIPGVVIAFGVIFMIVMSARGKNLAVRLKSV